MQWVHQRVSWESCDVIWSHNTSGNGTWNHRYTLLKNSCNAGSFIENVTVCFVGKNCGTVNCFCYWFFEYQWNILGKHIIAKSRVEKKCAKIDLKPRILFNEKNAWKITLWKSLGKGFFLVLLFHTVLFVGVLYLWHPHWRREGEFEKVSWNCRHM